MTAAAPRPYRRRRLADLRILEIGQFTLFNRVHPQITTQVWTGWAAHDAIDGTYVRAHAAALWQVRRALRDNRFDLVVCYPWEETTGRIGWGWFRRWLRALPLHVLRAPTAAPLIVLDVFDSPLIARQNRFLLRQCVYYFKRELQPIACALGPQPWDTENLVKLRPISIGIPDSTAQTPVARTPKSADVFFAGRIYPGPRTDGMRQLLALRRRGYAVDVPEHHLGLADYLRACSRAWLVWSPPGNGWDCFRHYEAAVAHSVPVMSRAPIHRYAPLRDGVHGFYYDLEGNDLTRVVRGALADRERLSAMAQAARTHVLAHFTHSRLCAYVLRTCFGDAIDGVDPSPPAAAVDVPVPP